jgi:DNA-binding SARP family transcriptional activator
MEPVDFKLFGGFEALRNGEEIPLKEFGRLKALKLLKLLLINRGHVISNDQIIEWLFPEQDPEKASNNIQGRISELRKAFEPDLEHGKDSAYIERNEHGYLIPSAAPIQTDLERYFDAVKIADSALVKEEWHIAIEQYEIVIEIYQGQFLEEELYEDWSIEMREHLKVKHLDALDAFADCLAHLGEYSRAIELAIQLQSLDPLSEKAIRAHMAYLHLQGEPQLALQICDNFAKQFASEWDGQLSHKTLELRTQIEQGAVPDLDKKYPQRLTPELIAQVPFFADLSKSELKKIMEMSTERLFNLGEFIIRKGDLGNSFYLIINGQVSVHLTDAVLKRGRGQYFGEMSLIDDWPRSADIRAHVTTRCLVIDRKEFQDMVHGHPEIALSMLKELSRRIREMDVGIEK